MRLIVVSTQAANQEGHNGGADVPEHDRGVVPTLGPVLPLQSPAPQDLQQSRHRSQADSDKSYACAHLQATIAQCLCERLYRGDGENSAAPSFTTWLRPLVPHLYASSLALYLSMTCDQRFAHSTWLHLHAQEAFVALA
jgi:hypothetical protein